MKRSDPQNMETQLLGMVNHHSSVADHQRDRLEAPLTKIPQGLASRRIHCIATLTPSTPHERGRQVQARRNTPISLKTLGPPLVVSQNTYLRINVKNLRSALRPPLL